MGFNQENPFDSLHVNMTGRVQDMSLDRRDAWAYGIIVGWEGESLQELQQLHGWTDEAIARLQRLHAIFNQHKDTFKDH